MTRDASTRPLVSVLVSADGSSDVTPTLISLAAQSLDARRFEVVVVESGMREAGLGFETAVAGLLNQRPGVRVIRQSEGGAARARNVALAAARGAYVTFLDAGDRISPGYLKALASAAEPDVVAVPSPDEQDAGRTVDPADAPSALTGFAALVYADLARSAAGSDLDDAGDLAFWARVHADTQFRLRLVPPADAAYQRRSEPATYDTEVRHRLRRLTNLPKGRLADALRTAQLTEINRYLRKHPDEHSNVVADVEKLKVDVDWRVVNEGLAHELAILYCFTPFVDTSGLVTARRIQQAGEQAGVLTDVVSQDMANLRDSDPASAQIGDAFIGRRHLVEGDSTWANWAAIGRFVRGVQKAIPDLEAANGHRYDRIYSRSMWAPSTLAAAFHKVRHPEVHWRAEFSDPLHYDTSRRVRGARMTGGPVMRELQEAYAAAGFTAPEGQRIFEWCERLAYALADEIVFTNENQREYMLGYCSDRAVAERARERSVVVHHPTLPPRFYDLVEADYELDPERVHVGYFGIFYGNRGITEVTDALRRLDEPDRERIKLHVFTADPYQVTKEAAELGLADVVAAGTFRPFLEFLNLTTRFDALIVNDARTREFHPVNPFLPSKLSDYAGSGADVWKIYEPGSVLGTVGTAYTSELGDVDGAEAVLRQLIATAAAR